MEWAWWREEEGVRTEAATMAKVRNDRVGLASLIGVRSLKTSPFFGPGLRLLPVFMSVPWEEVPEAAGHRVEHPGWAASQKCKSPTPPLTTIY